MTASIGLNKIVLSIIIPNCNSGKLLDESLQSIFECEVSFSFEVLIMDNHSTDHPEKIIEKFPYKNLYFYSESDSGIYHAMNKGLKKAKGDWLYFLGSGDKLNIGVLNNLYFERMADLIYFKFFFKSRNKIEGYEINLFDILRCNLCQQAIFYRATVFNSIGNFSNKYPILADYEFNLKIFFNQRLIKLFFPEVIAEYDGSGISSQKKDIGFNSDKNRIIINLLIEFFSVNNLYFVFRYYVRYIRNKVKFEFTKLKN